MNDYGVYGSGGVQNDWPTDAERKVSEHEFTIRKLNAQIAQLQAGPGDPPAAGLYSGNMPGGPAWISVDAVGNLFVYGGLVAPAAVNPSGDVTGAKDTVAIQGLLNANAGSVVVLGEGKFYLNAPLTIPPYTALVGQPNTAQVTQTDAGTTLVITSGFTGLTITDGGSVVLKGAIVLLGQTFGSYSTISEEQKIFNIQIDGTSGPASVNGIMSYGRVNRVHMSDILISTVTGDGVQHNLDQAGSQPDAWYGYKVFSRFNTGKGFNLRSADSTWLLCLSSNNGDAGVDFFINTTSNSKYIGCRSEHSAAGAIGFGYVCVNSGSSSGGISFIGCSTDQSGGHGFQVGGTINSVASFVHAVPVLFSGCIGRRDGQNGGSGGSFASFFISNYGTTSGGLVTLAGCQTWPGVNDDGSGVNAPRYGLWNSSSNVLASGCAFNAATTSIRNDAGTNNFDNALATGTGNTGTLAINMSPLSGTGTLVAGLGTVASTLIAATSNVELTPQVAGGSVGTLYVNSINAGTNFTVKSTVGTDTSTFFYRIYP